MESFIGVTPPGVHGMVMGLERKGLITRALVSPAASPSQSPTRIYRASGTRSEPLSEAANLAHALAPGAGGDRLSIDAVPSTHAKAREVRRYGIFFNLSSQVRRTSSVCELRARGQLAMQSARCLTCDELPQSNTLPRRCLLTADSSASLDANPFLGGKNARWHRRILRAATSGAAPGVGKL